MNANATQNYKERSAFLHPVETSGDFVLGFGFHDYYFGVGKAARFHISSTRPYMVFVHPGKMPRHFDRMHECISRVVSSNESS